MGRPICKKFLTVKNHPYRASTALRFSQGLDCDDLSGACYLGLLQKITAVTADYMCNAKESLRALLLHLLGGCGCFQGGLFFFPFFLKWPMGFHILSSKDNAKQTLRTYLELSADVKCQLIQNKLNRRQCS